MSSAGSMALQVVRTREELEALRDIKLAAIENAQKVIDRDPLNPIAQFNLKALTKELLEIVSQLDRIYEQINT